MKKFLIILVPCLAIFSCQAPSNKEVSLGDRAALERLAKAFENLSKDIRLSPSSLRPDKKKDFVIRVFNQAGYNYQLTLKHVATGFKKEEKLHKDLVELLFFAHERGWRPSKMSDIYNEEELKYINKIQKMR